MNLIRDFIESFRYANHLWPLFFLRLYVGYYFIYESISKKTMGFLDKPVLSAMIDENLFTLERAPYLIKEFFLNFVQPNWHFWSGLFINLEWVLGALIFAGVLVRPALLILFGYAYLISYVVNLSKWMALEQVTVMMLVLLVFGAGRVGGFDYFFYKRQRGLIW